MALATICPHCNTTFRVASDQLKLRGGIVRCGACNEVFDGNAALIDLAASQAPASAPPPSPVPVTDIAEQPASADAPLDDVPAPSASAAFDAEVAAIDAKQAENEEEPIYTLDFDTTFDPFGILPKTLQPTPASAPEAEPEPEAEPQPAPVADEELIALPVLHDEHEALAEAPEPAPAPAPVRDETADFQPPLLMRASAAGEMAPPPAPPPDPQVAISKSARRNAAKRKKAAPKPAPPVVAEPEPDVDEPEFVKRSRLKEETGRSRRIMLGAGSALLVLALAAQGMATFRNVLAARYPQARPLLVSTCAAFGCKIELPAQIDALSVETGELQSLGTNTFSYTTLLRNQGNLVQAWPHMELTLTDANDKPLVRRVFPPTDYLPPGVAAAKGLGARSEQPVKLFFELNQVKASGYHIAIFYP